MKGRLSRRTPPLLMGLVALALMLSIFPSALHLPINGVGGAAEVAPVPGQGRQSANLSQGQAAASSGVGSDGSAVTGGGSSAPASSPPPGAATLLCVGDPPRQTEDPLSPPCVNYWAGNNGGATAQGVTADSILVIVYDGEATNTGGRDFSAGAPVQATDDPYQRTFKYLSRYFDHHFEMYGRHVRLIQQRNSGSAEANQASDAAAAIQKHPFAAFLASAGGSDETTYISRLAAAGVVTFTPVADGLQEFSESLLNRYSPYLWSLLPSQEQETQSSASWICSELAGRPASHAGAAIQGKPRHLGIVVDSDNGGFYSAAGEAERSALQNRCGISFRDGQDYVSASGSSAVDDQAAMAKLQAAGVTTAFCACNAVTFFKAADQQTPPYQPEWLVNSSVRFSQPFFAREVTADQAAHLSGSTWYWKVPPISQTYWFDAYASVSGDGQFDSLNGFGIYESLMQLYTAIQRAGPRLSGAAIQRGFEGYGRPSPGPGSPLGAYSAGDHSFFKDAVMEVFDPTGQIPGGADPSSQGPGCFSLPGGGARYQPTTWPAGDRENDGGPCSADFTSHANSGANSGGGTPGPGF